MVALLGGVGLSSLWWGERAEVEEPLSPLIAAIPPAPLPQDPGSEDTTGGAFPTIGGCMAQPKHWWQSPDDRNERNTLVWLTLVLIAMMATNVLL